MLVYISQWSGKRQLETALEKCSIAPNVPGLRLTSKRSLLDCKRNMVQQDHASTDENSIERPMNSRCWKKSKSSQKMAADQVF